MTSLLCFLAIFVCLFGATAVGQPIDVQVGDRLLKVNGIDEVPRGLFGVHAAKLTPERIADWGIESVRLIHQKPTGVPIVPGAGTHEHLKGLSSLLECHFDRYQPAFQLTRDDWKPYLEDIATRYGAASVQSDREHWVEFWNEPYLNWSVKPGVNYDGVHFDESRAVEGGPVHRKGAEQPEPHLVWRRGLKAVDIAGGKTDYVAWGRMPANAKPGDTYEARERTWRLEEAWLARDPTQKSYWAGKYNDQLYRQMLAVFAPALKKANPRVQLIAGWDFHFYQGDWDAWHSLFKPMIDQQHAELDGISEHHYGEDTRRTAASYDVVWNYVLARYGKQVGIYNTEAGGMLDPERPDTPAHPGHRGTPIERARGAMSYALRDIIHLIDVSPDKARSRYAHEPDQNGGDEIAFKLLKPLRGKLVETRSADPRIWVVGSWQAGRLTVVVFNDHPEARPVRLSVRPPGGATIGQVTQMAPLERDGVLSLESMQLASLPDQILIAPKSAVTFVCELQGGEAPRTLVRTQHVSGDILMRVAADRPARVKITAPKDALEPGSRFQLRYVVSGDTARGALRLNGNVVPLRPGPWIVREPVDAALVREENEVEFSCDSGTYRIDAVSLEVDR